MSRRHQPSVTDVWIVDAKQDKVFKYTGAASRLSGSQNAASSFNLNSGNTSPKDIVTDGGYLWVVNDSSTDKVFKYTVTGSLVGSWTITTSGASSPTGITIDPSNVSDIWIVDSGADKVFQYTAAASRTSGSQAAATSFLLAAGNTNPQGIADPPSPTDRDSVTAQTRAIGRRHAQAGASPMQTESVDHYFATVRERDSSPHSKPYVSDLLASLLEANEHLSKKGRMHRFAR